MITTPQDVQAAFHTLQIEPTADVPKIRAAFRSRIFTAHPDRGGDTREAQAVSAAWELLSREADAGRLVSLVTALRAPPAPALSPPPSKAETRGGEVKGAPGSLRTAFPDLARRVVLEHQEGARWALWIGGTLVRSGMTPKAACTCLFAHTTSVAGPESLPVSIFVRGERPVTTTLGEAEQHMRAVSAAHAPTPKAEPVVEVVLPEAVQAAWGAASWGVTGLELVSWLLFVADGRTSVWSGRRLRRGKVDAQWKGVYDSSELALRALRVDGIQPETCPVFVFHALEGAEITKL